MAVADSIQRYPLLRLLVAYLLGIGIAHVVYPLVDCKLLAFVSMLIALSMLVILAVCVVRSKGTQVVFGVWASLFFVSIGTIGYMHERHVSAFEWSPTKMIYEARVRKRRTFAFGKLSVNIRLKYADFGLIVHISG